MSIVNVEALKGLGAVLYWPGAYAESGAYDDDGNKRGFMILPAGVTVTPSGTFTTQKMKDGRKYLKFDGSTNYITLSNHSNFSLISGDFTISFWSKATFTAASHTIIMGYIKWATDVDFAIYFRRASTSLRVLFGPNIPIILDSGVITAGVWYFFTITRIGTTYTLYMNGQYVTSVTNSTALTNNSIKRIGADLESTPTEYMDSSIKDFMIFKGKALSQDQIAAIMQETYIY